MRQVFLSLGAMPPGNSSVAGPDFSFYDKKFSFCFTVEPEYFLFFLNGVLFTQETPNEIILLCRSYDAALRQGKIESWTK